MSSTPPLPPLPGGQVPVRFPGGLAASARRLARQDGMSLSAWIRAVVARELASRAGKCPACGQDTGGQQPG